MKFAPYYPIYPHKVNQVWGVYDPKDYAQFGFTRHNGEDDAMGDDALVRAPFNGKVYDNGFQPNGGGIFCGFLSDDEFDFDAFTCTTLDNVAIHFPAGKYRVLMDFLHLKSISAVEGQSYKTGDVMAAQDNTGFSTGPHTHIQPRRVTFDGIKIAFVDSNDANGTFSLTYFWNGKYAKDYAEPVDAPPAEDPLPPLPKPPGPLTPSNASSWLIAVAGWLHSLDNWLTKNKRS